MWALPADLYRVELSDLFKNEGGLWAMTLESYISAYEITREQAELLTLTVIWEVAQERSQAKWDRGPIDLAIPWGAN